jgi:hypothetical protein
MAPRAGDEAAVVATATWASSPVAIAYALGGLETSLALLLAVGCALAWSEAAARSDLRRYAVAGALGGLALLARIDTALLLGILFAAEVLRGRRAGAVAAALTASAVVAPWWIYELGHFGTVVPESGAAVRQLVAIHRAIYLTTPKQLAWALGAVFEGAFTCAVDWRDLFSSVPALALVLTPLVVVGMVRALRLSRAGSEAAPIRGLVVFGIAVWAFYAFYVPVIWFFPRYLAPVQVALTLLFATGLGAAWPPRSTGWARASWYAAAAVPVLGLVTALALLVRAPAETADTGLHGAKGYRDPARAVLAALPQGAVLGSLQSGALAYYAAFDRPDVRVVNLDGVVDAAAAEALREGRLAAFARGRGVEYIADWSFNIDTFLRHAGDDRLSASSLRTIAYAPAQGPDRFELDAIAWP